MTMPCGTNLTMALSINASQPIQAVSALSLLAVFACWGKDETWPQRVFQSVINSREVVESAWACQKWQESSVFEDPIQLDNDLCNDQKPWETFKDDTRNGWKDRTLTKS